MSVVQLAELFPVIGHPEVFASGYGDAATQELAGSKHLAKPYDHGDLVRILRE